MTAPMLMLAALLIEVAIGWPKWLFTAIRHPVVWIGQLTSTLDNLCNRPGLGPGIRLVLGALVAITVIAGTTYCAHLIAAAIPDTSWGHITEAFVASSLLAARSLYQHVAAVIKPLEANDLEAARSAVSHIVGRDSTQLTKPEVARATLESLAENTSDGVIAPLFWGAIFGLPGIAAYKAINTLDSMIGHQSDRYGMFGRCSARLDDIANLVPARLTAALIVVAGARWPAFGTIVEDARRHRSPNAGWPESALAYSLKIRLSGPRTYGRVRTNDSWINACAPDPDASRIRFGLLLYIRTVGIGALILLSWSFAGLML